MDRECNKCVYSTRDGECRKWSCEGTVTVGDLKNQIMEDVLMIMRAHSDCYKQKYFKSKDIMDHKIYLALNKCLSDVERLNDQNIY